MRSSSIIRQFFAGFLLFVFAFAITPKRYLHNLVANHHDTYNKLTDGKTEISSAKIYCQCDNLVATSPFTGSIEKSEIKIPLGFVSYQEDITLIYPHSAHIYCGLRGPPAFLII